MLLFLLRINDFRYFDSPLNRSFILSIYDEYVDDGISEISFERPGVQRMLEDAKNGNINFIIYKDMSRFGRNYIQVGQYVNYIFPMYNIRFIALNDNIDTANSDSASMDMLPKMNVFNEWHAVNTSKKLRAVFDANAKAGRYKSTVPTYGYLKGTDKNKTPVVEPRGVAIVRRDKVNWAVIENYHEPIISQEL